MLTAKKVHIILITPAMLLILVLAGCLNKECNCPNNNVVKIANNTLSK